MRTLQTEVLVIGGGATGTGVLRDLAMRGVQAVLVERRDLTHGTTGRYHGLLHSGGRYVVKDPQAARECIEENRILRRIMPQCIEDTGGFFVVTPWDNPDYIPRFVEGCHSAGIPVEEVPLEQMLKEEPRLNTRISHCFRVPDASADSFLAADLNAEAARQLGAQVLTYHPVQRLLTAEEDIKPGPDDHPRSPADDETDGARVVGALCTDLVSGEAVAIYADLVINAAGAWAGVIAGSVGINIHIIPGKGTMLAMNHRIVNTVINRCKMPSDGDILVPAHTVSVIGTTDVQVSDPDQFAIEPWEVNLCLEEGDKMIPGFKSMRMLRAWAGVRPLYQETAVSDTRDVTRAYVLLDHAQRDNTAGLITITSGKWTTYRLMAQVTVDLACQKLGVDQTCRTHLEPLPVTEEMELKYHHLGHRLAKVESEGNYGELICECELATRRQVERAILEAGAKTIDDIRRDVRLGMGPCQGGFCTYRIAGLLHQLRSTPVEATNVALRDFLQERWKGLLPVLWGGQLRQERFDELIYLSILNSDHLPGPAQSVLASSNYQRPPAQPKAERPTIRREARATESPLPKRPQFPGVDVLVVGGGLAGLVASWQAASANLRTKCITKGWGATHWQPGCIDVLGYHKSSLNQPVEALYPALQALVQQQPEHPYAIAGLDMLAEAVQALKDLCASAEYPLQGSLDENWLLPSALGTIRPTCLAPASMTSGDLRKQDSLLIVGFEQFPDFYSHLIADNLSAQGFSAKGVMISSPILASRRFVTGRVLANAFEDPEFRNAVVTAIKPHLSQAGRVGVPAVLGLDKVMEILEDLQNQLGLPVFEIPTLPPSIPGIRLYRILQQAIEINNGMLYDGMEALGMQLSGDTVQLVWTEAAARRHPHRARQFILATGGLLGGGLQTDYSGAVHETVAGLQVEAPPDRLDWFQEQFLGDENHAIFSAGIAVNERLQALDYEGHPVFDNLRVAGNLLGRCDAIRERSLDGIALVTGYLAGRLAASNG